MIIIAMIFFVLSLLLGASTYIFWQISIQAKKATADLREQCHWVGDAEAHCEQQRQRAIAYQKQCADLELAARENQQQRTIKYQKQFASADEQQRKKIIASQKQRADVEASINQLIQDKNKLKKKISKYREAISDIENVAELKKYREQLEKNHGELKSLSQIESAVQQKQIELKTVESCIGASQDLKEILAKQKFVENSLTVLLEEKQSLEEEIGDLDGVAEIRRFNYWEDRYEFEHVEEYKTQIDSLRGDIKPMLKRGGAAYEIVEPVTIENSVRKGATMQHNVAKALLAGFNGEVTGVINDCTHKNMERLIEKLRRVFAQANKLGATSFVEISTKYLDLRIKELILVYEWKRRKKFEDDERREFEKEMRAEAKAQKKAQAAVKEAESEEKARQKELRKAEREKIENESKIANLLTKMALAHDEEKTRLRGMLDQAETQAEALAGNVEHLVVSLQEAVDVKARAVSNAQLSTRGYIYVCSNRGVFGENCFKIGMTRRDDPSERYRELGSAGVPWGVDVHVSVLVQDAPALESELHNRFSDRRVNQVNRRKEWFHITIEEIRDAILELYGPCEFNPDQPSQDYEETIDYYEKKGIVFQSERTLSSVSDSVISGIPRNGTAHPSSFTFQCKQ